jgi:hypothetical protein
MEKEIELKPGEGNFYSAMAFHWAVVSVAIVPVTLVLILAVINPFWFRDSFFSLIERGVNRLSRWRNYKKYHIYLGTDPKMWHTLKGDLK